MRVCMCVCVCAEDRKGERGWERIYVCVCVRERGGGKRERVKERESERKTEEMS
jgi:hypothetical protein